MRLRTTILTILAALALAATAKDYKYESVPGDPMRARVYTLANGLKVYLSVNAEKPRVQTYIAVRTGSRNDPAETTGLAHYLEHLMFKGTDKLGTSDYAKEKPYLDEIERRYEAYRRLTDPEERKRAYHEIDSVSQLAARYNIPNEYDKLMSSIGAEGTNAYTSHDQTVYTENIPSNEVEKWLRVEGERFQNMVVRGFHTELEAVYEEYNIGLASDGEKEYDALFAKLFPGHPYGTQTTIGTQEHLKNPSITNIKDYFRRYYVPNNVAICMAGDLDPDKVVALVDKYFGAWKADPALSCPQYAPVRSLEANADTTVVGQEAENVILAWKADGASSLQADTLELLDRVLCNGTAGLLDLNVNQKMRCLAAYSGTYALREYGVFLAEGMPNKGQTLDEVRAIVLGEIERLKRGDFPDDLIPSVVTNMRKAEQYALESNDSRAGKFVDAFVNERPWADVVGQLDRVSRITKAELVGFANRFFATPYVAVYKREGNDTTQRKIEKPAITAIPTNRDSQSALASALLAEKTAPIEPRFLDFDKDLAKLATKKGLPVLYVRNTTNQTFSLTYRYEHLGTQTNKWLGVAAEYCDLLGTDKLSPEQVRQMFYKLGCTYGISVSDYAVSVRVGGLSENMDKAIALVEEILPNYKVDKDAWEQYVAQTEKARRDAKLDQRANYRNLVQYGLYGETRKQLLCDSLEYHRQDPAALTAMVRGLRGLQHTVLYYGPLAEKELLATIDKNHKTAKRLAPIADKQVLRLQQTPANEIVIAPYDAKNVYMMQYHNEGLPYDAGEEALVTMFDEYFGGGMNTVVFQELRETRGLAYSAWAAYHMPWRKDQPEYFTTSIISQNDKLMDCIRTFNSIMDTVPQSQAAFDIAKQSVTKRMQAARTTKMGIINAYLGARYLGRDYDINKQVYEALPSITLQDLVRFCNERVAHKPFRYLILGDERELDVEALERIAPIRRVSTEEIFGY